MNLANSRTLICALKFRAFFTSTLFEFTIYLYRCTSGVRRRYKRIAYEQFFPHELMTCMIHRDKPSGLHSTGRLTFTGKRCCFHHLAFQSCAQICESALFMSSSDSRVHHPSHEIPKFSSSERSPGKKKKKLKQVPFVADGMCGDTDDPEDPWPQQLNSGGIRDDPPFSQLPYAPRCGLALRPDAAAAGDGHQSGSDATPPRLKRSANTFVGPPLASPIKWPYSNPLMGLDDRPATSKDNSPTKNEANRRLHVAKDELRKSPYSAPHQAVKPLYYGAYLTLNQGGAHRVQHTTRPDASLGGDTSLSLHPADSCISPSLNSSPNRTGNRRPPSHHSSMGTGQSVCPSKYLFRETSPLTPSQCHVSPVESPNSHSSSLHGRESSDESAGQSGDETDVFEDALSMMRFSYCASPIGFKAHRKSIQGTSSSLPPPSCLSSSAASINVPTRATGSQKVDPAGTTSR
ncbi:hypothetical protein VP01_258g1 [Puccinia sorghi]|uniref:Uncharacterized protein n=1 Tax=Puccinia sorghi TaxID=27349 RepID=A0A0L6V4V2_9BASI|nr:hypothetical protein VP01_258g1 [Puccinia sorghi]